MITEDCLDLEAINMSGDRAARDQMQPCDSLLVAAFCSPQRKACRSTPLVLLPFSGRVSLRHRCQLAWSSSCLLDFDLELEGRRLRYLEQAGGEGLRLRQRQRQLSASTMSVDAVHRDENEPQTADDETATSDVPPLAAQSIVSRYRSQLDLRYDVTPTSVVIMQHSSPRSGSQLYSHRTESYATASPPFRRRPAHEVISLLTSIRQLQIDSEVEKRSMNELNRKLATYIEKNRRLEDTNRQTLHELRILQENIMKGSVEEEIKEMLETELRSTKLLLADAENLNCTFTLRIETLHQDIEQLKARLNEEMKMHDASRERCDGLNQQLTSALADMQTAKFRADLLLKERDQLTADKSKLLTELAAAKDERERESFQCQYLCKQLLVAEEKIKLLESAPPPSQRAKPEAPHATSNGTELLEEFIKRPVEQLGEECHEDLEDLRLKIQLEYDGAVREQGSELARLGEELKRTQVQRDKAGVEVAHYKCLCDEMQITLDNVRSAYDDAVHKLQDDNKKLQRSADAKQEEIDRLMEELRNLMQCKSTLDEEISVYRRLVEMVHSRTDMETQTDTLLLMNGYQFLPERHTCEITVNRAMQPISEKSITLNGGVRVLSGGSQIEAGAMIAQTHCYRRSVGHIEIKEYGFDGKFVLIRNSGWREEQMFGWTVTSQVDDGADVTVTKLTKLILAPGETLKVWTKGNRLEDIPETSSTGTSATKEIEVEAANFGLGKIVNLTLTDEDNHVRAVYNHKTVYASV